MPKFKDLPFMFAYIKKSINNALENNVAPLVEKTMDEKIDSEVYDVYTPKGYKRRYELGNTNNISSELVKDGVLFTKNTANPSPSVIGTPYSASGSTIFPEWVNDGEVPNIFNSNDYPWMHPRDFIAATIEELESTGAVATAMAKGLQASGISVKVSVKRG